MSALGDHQHWLRPLIIAGTATAAAGFLAYCLHSCQHASRRASEYIVIRRSSSASSSIHSYDVDGHVINRRDATRIHTTQRIPMSVSRLSDVCENDEEGCEEEKEQATHHRPPGGLQSVYSFESFESDPFDESGTLPDLSDLPFKTRPRSDSIYPGDSSSMLPELGSNPFSGAGRKRVLILGLDGAGKSTLLKQLSGDMEKNKAYEPTNGFRVIALATQSCQFDLFEVGGNSRNRSYWSLFLDNIDLLMFVLDGCSTPERLETATEELATVMADGRMDGVPLLLVVTHQDRLQSLSPDEAAVAIRLPDYEGSRHMCRAVGVSLHHGDPPEGISKLRSLMFPVLARAVEMQDDAAGDS